MTFLRVICFADAAITTVSQVCSSASFHSHGSTAWQGYCEDVTNHHQKKKKKKKEKTTKDETLASRGGYAAVFTPSNKIQYGHPNPMNSVAKKLVT